MASYLECAKSIGVAINDKFSIVPGQRSGEKGLYVYTDRGAFFFPLGAPHIEENGAQEFLLAARVPDVGDIFISFREKKSGGGSSSYRAIGYQTTVPSIRDLGDYRVTPANDSLDEHATKFLSQRLKERVASIKDFIDNKNSFSTPDEAKRAFEKDRVIYRAKLERCRIETDRELNSAVSSEVQKLDSGFPGITIWEKEIGSKPATGR